MEARGTARRRLAAVLMALLLAVLAALAWAQPARAAYRGFADVSPTAWYVQGGWLDYVVDNGIMTGTKDPATQLPSGRFEPEGTVTRGQVATILYRIANPGSSATTAPSDYGRYSSFSDVRTRYYYTAAIEWCYSRGIVTGYRDPVTQSPTGRFGPEDPVTREQLATMLYRFAVQELGLSKAAPGSGAASMPDFGRVQPFAEEAVRWCYARGILTGSVLPGGTLLLPRGEATRAQTAKMAAAMLTSAETAGEARAVLYADGTLVIQRGSEADPSHGAVLASWDGVEGASGQPWAEHAGRVRAVVVRDPVAPRSTARWFAGMSRCESMDLSGLDTYYVTDMSFMFSGCSRLTFLDLSGWETSKVTSMHSMFSGCSSLVSLDLTGWDTSKVTSMHSMFSGCSSLSSVEGIGVWETSKVTDMSCMFSRCSSLISLDISDWNTWVVKDMYSMFFGCSSLTSLNPSTWDVSQVMTMYGMFEDCSSLTSLDLSGWDVSRVEGMYFMFSGCSSLASLNLSGWHVSQITGTMNCTFQDCSSLTSLDLSGWDTSRVISMSSVFSGCSSLASLNLSGWDMSQVAGMESTMFSGCSCLASLNLSGFRFPASGFRFPSSLEEVLLEGSDISSAESMSSMFSGCSSLASVDLSGWDTSSVTDTSYMFYGCSSLASLDLSGWDTSPVHRSDFMVYGCYHLAEVALGNRFTRYFLILPTPSSDYIPGATGLWYGPDGTGYRPADIPVGVAATYTALPPATAAPAAQPADLEEPPALALAFSLYPGGLLEVCPCGSDPSVPGEPLASWELPGDARLASAADAPWAEYASQVLEVRVLDGVRPASCAFWFSGMSGCAKFDLTGLDTSACSDFTGVFEGCDPMAEVVLGPLFSAVGDGTCAPCELPKVPEEPAPDVPATGTPADAPDADDSDSEEGLPTQRPRVT